MHSGGQGRGVFSFLPVLCLIAICKDPFPLPTGDGGRWIKLQTTGENNDSRN